MNAVTITPRRFAYVVLITSIWVNVSVIARYFLYVMPRTRAFFGDRSGIAQIDIPIALILGACGVRRFHFHWLRLFGYPPSIPGSREPIQE